MPRFFVPPEQINDKQFILTGTEARHAALVLRKKVGDVIDLFDGKDQSYQGRIDAIGPDQIQGILLSKQTGVSVSGPDLILYQALIKGPKWDWLVEKACEVGVTRLAPITTLRTVMKPSRPDVHERWGRIAMAASKQCDRSKVMEIAEVLTFNEALNRLPKNCLTLIPWEKEAAKTIREAFLSSPADSGRGSIALFIGPEGGWDTQEIELALSKSAIPVRLGPTLLRSETAGLVAATLVLSECGVYS